MLPLKPSIAVGIRALGANPVRTFLSTLGVIMGVASLVAVFALGDGVESYARQQLSRTTSIQAIEISPKRVTRLDGVLVPVTDYPVFTASDAQELLAAVAQATQVHLNVVGAGRLRLPGSDSVRGATVMGLAGWPSFEPPPLAAGRFIDPAAPGDSGSVVVSHRIAAALGGAKGAAAAVGMSLRLEQREWPVVGVLRPSGPEEGFSVFVPVGAAGAAMAPSSETRPPSLVLTVGRVEEVAAAKGAVERWLASRDPEWQRRTTVATQLARAEQAKQGMMLFKLLMGAITGISLLVGGIGIMNVLLASVAERTREIGVRKAVGARRRDVLLQFLSESVAITGAGAVLGTLTGLGGAFGVTAIMRATTNQPVYAAFTWGTVGVAVVAAVTVGLVFGTYPALRAAKLPPIEAIRHE